MRIKKYMPGDETVCLRSMIFAVLLFTFLPGALAAGDTIYRWTDANGVTHMTNIAPVQGPDKIEIIELAPPPIPEEPEVQYVQPEEPAAVPDQTAVTIMDNHVIVPVVLSHKGREVTARLLLDTGSTLITLHSDIAKKLAVKKPQKGSIRVAGGELIEAEAVLLDTVTVGPHTMKNLTAAIIENRGRKVPFDGMLGMNFLKNYQYSIDFDNQVLLWNN